MTGKLRSLLLAIAVMCSVSLVLAGPAAAQSSVDIEEIGEIVLDTDTDDLLTGLEEPMRDRDLPEGFSDAEFVPAEDVTPEMGLLGEDSLEGALGSVAYTLVGDPEVVGGETVISSIQYVGVDPDEMTDDVLDDFVTGAEGGMEGLPADAEASVDVVEVEGVDAALITFEQDAGTATVVVQYLAIPVGNVFVFAAVTTAGEDIDADDVYTFTEELTLSAVEHLGSVAEDV